jgi:Fe-S cluster assembly iron-binding protein IscA
LEDDEEAMGLLLLLVLLLLLWLLLCEGNATMLAFPGSACFLRHFSHPLARCHIAFIMFGSRLVSRLAPHHRQGSTRLVQVAQGVTNTRWRRLFAIQGVPPKYSLEITDKCAEQAHYFTKVRPLEQSSAADTSSGGGGGGGDQFLRVLVRAGGCGIFEYSFALDHNLEDSDMYAHRRCICINIINTMLVLPLT